MSLLVYGRFRALYPQPHVTGGRGRQFHDMRHPSNNYVQAGESPFYSYRPRSRGFQR